MVLQCKGSEWRNNGIIVEANLTNSMSTGNATSNSTSGGNATGGSTGGSTLPPFNPTVPEPWTCDSESYPYEFTEGTYRNQIIVVGDTRLPPRNANATALAAALLEPAFQPNQAQINLVSLCPTD